MYGKRAPWEDPSKWVLDTYPWSSVSQPQEGPALLQLRPEDVGYEGCTSAKEATTSKHIPQTDTEGDPLVRSRHLILPYNLDICMWSLVICYSGNTQIIPGNMWNCPDLGTQF
jgi:hypothetical protein